mmetsp:Transcript_410/g.423  ORF Transcript_410/g.423 Transcript_410/m.423 type:complete len:199 (-) Transcript_410:140-736(-)|eukprot:CAMPEP_0182427628 /NCGR_PEP_ID=MMETSP1167-20130531/18928_1 /TAXON_ID=2988 /ORGANISM="Mallomonas Sp, Strain CCMP3275" /LENGTH=198 /DNA_ID=CAMNT_0024609999 /DNA_START=61 /DNA_END=657 /DNA_ORIENTATION=-
MEIYNENFSTSAQSPALPRGKAEPQQSLKPRKALGELSSSSINTRIPAASHSKSSYNQPLQNINKANESKKSNLTLAKEKGLVGVTKSSLPPSSKTSSIHHDEDMMATRFAEEALDPYDRLINDAKSIHYAIKPNIDDKNLRDCDAFQVDNQGYIESAICMYNSIDAQVTFTESAVSPDEELPILIDSLDSVFAFLEL